MKDKPTLGTWTLVLRGFQRAWLLIGNESTLPYSILTLFMIPGALTALQPIDMESYEMESPEPVSYTHLTLPTTCAV